MKLKGCKINVIIVAIRMIKYIFVCTFEKNYSYGIEKVGALKYHANKANIGGVMLRLEGI